MNNNTTYPEWYPFKQDKSGQKTLRDDEIINFIVDRYNLYSPNGLKDFIKEGYEDWSEFLERGQKDRRQHRLIALGVCTDARLSQWFIEMEGDLFRHRFAKNSNWEEKESIINHLYEFNGEKLWKTLFELEEEIEEDLHEVLGITEHTSKRVRTSIHGSYELQDILGNSKVIALDFRYATTLVKNRKSILYNGWIIDTVEKLTTTIKNRFEELLENKLRSDEERVKYQAGGEIKRLQEMINQKLQKLVQNRLEYKFENIKLEGSFQNHYQKFPPCIQDLMNAVDTVGYIGHWERFQLGIFLKQMGMPVDEQLEFWYNKAVDNINLSFDEFKKKAGYVIRHIYGMEGGKVDYDMPNCSTIQNKMYCTFRHKDIEFITSKLNSIVKDVKEEDKSKVTSILPRIIDATLRGQPNLACGFYLQLNTDQNPEYINHPFNYMREFLQSVGSTESIISDEQSKLKE